MNVLLVDNVRLGQYVEMRDLLIAMCWASCLSDSRQVLIHCSNGIPYLHWCRVHIGGSGG